MYRFLPVCLDLSAEAVDIDHDGIVIHGHTGAPDLFIDHVFGKDLARIKRKNCCPVWTAVLLCNSPDKAAYPVRCPAEKY